MVFIILNSVFLENLELSRNNKFVLKIKYILEEIRYIYFTLIFNSDIL